MNDNQNSNLKKKIGVIGHSASRELAKNLHELAKEAGVMVVRTAELKKEVNLAQGLSAKGKTRNPNYRSSRRLLRSLKTNRVIFGGGSKLTRPITKHPDHLYGKLNSPVRVNVKNPDGSVTQKLEKLKIAVKKGLVKTA